MRQARVFETKQLATQAELDKRTDLIEQEKIEVLRMEEEATLLLTAVEQVLAGGGGGSSSSTGSLTPKRRKQGGKEGAA